MKKYFVSILYAFIALSTMFLLQGCPSPKKIDCGCDPREKSENCGCDSVVKEESIEADSMVVFIDASGSIKGYFSVGSDNSVGNTVSLLSRMSKGNAHTYFYGSKKEINVTNSVSGGVPESLRSKVQFGQDTYFDKMFKTMIDSIDRHNDMLCCLVSDGIYGVSSSYSNKDRDYAKETIEALKGDVSKVFKDKKMAVSIYHMKGGFYSSSKSDAYWTYSNEPIFPLDIKERPYYVIVIGQPERIRYFKDNNKLNAINELHIGWHEIEHNHNCTRLGDARHFKNCEWTGKRKDVATISANIPRCIGNDDFIKRNLEVTLNGKPVDISKCKVNNNRLTVEIAVMTDHNVKKGVNCLEVRIKNQIPTVWTDTLSTDDDSKIKSDSSLQKKTFGLKWLIEGIYEGINETELMDIKFYFKK